MKIIFLDIDGVLNVCHKEHDDYGNIFHPAYVANLKKIINMTNSKIVISSSWRSSGLKEMQEMWKHRNLPGEVIDTTPGLYSDSITSFSDEKYDNTPSIPRGVEIQYWLKNKGFYHINWSREVQLDYIKKSGIESYVIIDDDSDMLLEQKDHFVKCSLNYTHQDSIEGLGLTKKCRDKAIKILNSTI